MDETTKNRIEELIREEITVVPYDASWVRSFEDEAAFLRGALPRDLVGRIEHFGSTAVPGMSAKPIIDILVEVASLEETVKRIVPILAGKGYEYFWRPAFGDDGPPWYAWFIKRDREGRRTHHVHMVERDSELWDRLCFRDYLREFPEEARSYGELKRAVSQRHPGDRVAYTRDKSDYIISVTEKAKEYYRKKRDNPGKCGSKKN
jgi:GrpB-like predicted nucleotidyltransferase (UPF0157 family)